MIDKELQAFYNEYCKIPIIADGREKLKWDYFKKHLNNYTLYKYISFTEDCTLNNIKLETLRRNNLWFAAHHTLHENDPSEFKVTANMVRIHKQTGLSFAEISHLLNIFRELNDVCCLSDRLHEYMWENYANNHSGICCVFSITDVDILYPVIYCNKKNIDFTSLLVQSLRNRNSDCEATRRLSFIPNVLKDEQKYGEEHEVRLLSGEIYDKEESILGGRVEAGKKKDLGYKGTSYSYSNCGLSLEKIIIGKNTPMDIVEKLKELSVIIELE